MANQIIKSDSELYFPVIQEIKIDNFSLYKKAEAIKLRFDKEVFCLAGANGLGKSTFLTIVNFGLTGVVLDPDKNFGSIVSTETFYNKLKSFSNEYFDGRIEEKDRELASVTIKFKLGKYEYELTREFFSSDELIFFERRSEGVNTIDSNLDEHELFNFYSEYLVKDAGLASFDQYVFLQLFVFTFDEHHYLLFWDKTLMETSLYLFFGLSIEDAKRANILRKKINKLGSNIRNFTYHRGRTRKELRQLESKIKNLKEESDNNPERLEIYEKLLEQKENLENSITSSERKLKETELNIADLSIQISDLKSRYQKTFNQFISPPIDLKSDEKIIELLGNLKAEVCNGNNPDVIYDKITSYIKMNLCSPINEDEKIISEQLSKIDNEIKDIGVDINDYQKRKERLNSEISELEKKSLQIDKEIIKIEEEESDLINKFKASSSKDLTGLLDSYRDQIETLNKEIREKKKQKTSAEKDLKKLEKILNRNFAEAEKHFIPIFQNYVENFLGLDVAINIKSSNKGTTLVLEINNSERSNIYQLSESQRYFVDIGLRMALIQYRCSSAMLLIDTPEGSLDIAYESRAGKMFAEFAKSKYKLMMTANINTSQLLIELAKHCKHEGMSLENMTDWAFLSEVQYEEQSKIDSAFEQIENSLSNN